MPGYEPSRGRCPTKFPFTNAFFVASVLDPAFGFQWLEHDVELDSHSKENLKNEIKGEIFLINNLQQLIVMISVMECYYNLRCYNEAHNRIRYIQ